MGIIQETRLCVFLHRYTYLPIVKIPTEQIIQEKIPIFVVLSFTSYGKMKLFTVVLILCLQAGSLLGVAVPEFHNVLIKSPSMAKHFLANQHSRESKMSDGAMYLANHRSGTAENVI